MPLLLFQKPGYFLDQDLGTELLPLFLTWLGEEDVPAKPNLKVTDHWEGA